MKISQQSTISSYALQQFGKYDQLQERTVATCYRSELSSALPHSTHINSCPYVINNLLDETSAKISCASCTAPPILQDRIFAFRNFEFYRSCTFVTGVAHLKNCSENTYLPTLIQLRTSCCCLRVANSLGHAFCPTFAHHSSWRHITSINALDSLTS